MHPSNPALRPTSTTGSSTGVFYEIEWNYVYEMIYEIVWNSMKKCEMDFLVESIKWSLKSFWLLALVWNGVWNGFMKCRLWVSLHKILQYFMLFQYWHFMKWYMKQYETEWNDIWNSMK